jgi:hypothetical protein
MRIYKMLIPIFFGLIISSSCLAQDYPSVEIGNGQIRAKVYLPDAEKGFYRSTRFDWSGAIGSLEYKGHNYYGPWFAGTDPKVWDFTMETSEVISAPFTAMVGPAEEFNTDGTALGWSEAKPGGTFVKIGVGVLRKPANDDHYDHSKPYDIVDGGKWSVKNNQDSIEFTHVLNDPADGYGYVYRKVIRLVPGKPEMVIEHSLRNTGSKEIVSTVYNHNFLVLDKQAPGPDFTITVPFQLKPIRPLNPALGEVRGNQITWVKTLEKTDRMAGRFGGFSDKASDYDIRVENRKVRAGFHVRGDHPLTNLALWSIRTVLAIEPYNSMSIAPGKEFDWKLNYDYYTLPAPK